MFKNLLIPDYDKTEQREKIINIEGNNTDYVEE